MTPLIPLIPITVVVVLTPSHFRFQMSTSVLLTMVAVNILASTHTSPSPVFADRDTLWAGIKRPAKVTECGYDSVMRAFSETLE